MLICKWVRVQRICRKSRMTSMPTATKSIDVMEFLGAGTPPVYYIAVFAVFFFASI
jgi:hypothetical protein